MRASPAGAAQAGAGTALLEGRAPRPGSGDPSTGAGGGDDDGGNGGNGGDGGNGDGDGDRPPDAEHEGPRRRAPGAAELALRLALVAISSLFLIFTAVFVHLRHEAPQWPPPGMPGAPRGLVVSTVCLALSSTLLVRAALARGPGQRRTRARWLAGTLAAGLGFLTSQAVIWWRLLGSGLMPPSGRYAALFYALTGLHALHVLAGLAYITRLWARGRDPRAAGPTSNDMRLAGMYWHFMGLVWVVLLTLLWLPVEPST
ncbi:MAG: cytochrome c oxidase subunit 3 [Planctomycetota bacterium]